MIPIKHDHDRVVRETQARVAEHYRGTGMAEVASESDGRTVNNSDNSMRHNYKELDDAERAQMAIKDAGLAFAQLLDKIGESGDQRVGETRLGRQRSRELSLAATKIEEAVMWAVKHVTG